MDHAEDKDTYDKGYADGVGRMTGCLTGNAHGPTLAYLRGLHKAVSNNLDRIRMAITSEERDEAELGSEG